ncbi:unnamed protein product [Ectocarpus sp. 4 AP-2014]
MTLVVIGASLSHDFLMNELSETFDSIKHRLGVLKTETATLRKSVINNRVAHDEHGRTIAKLGEHIFNAKLLEEGRSRSVRHHKKSNKQHAQSLVQT